ncbi:MAG TPA: phospholipase D-like domain-containing protein [Vicinamibacterales bacterium]|nr:phospholipase D-like domain-containing protein [Vicinamibacterales bacterium]
MVVIATGAPAQAQEELLFPAVDNVSRRIVDTIRQERVRLDIALWLLTEHEISLALVDAHRAGIPVRVLGDRAAIFESDPATRREFEYLAGNGVPIRLRYHPRSFPEAMHWKCGIFVGQHLVEFGSANWTTFELRPASATNFKDETVMFSGEPSIVNAFRTMFDRMWVDTTHFLDWPAAYRLETGATWSVPMTISRARLEPEHATELPELVWSQGSALLERMRSVILGETQRIDLVSYRTTSSLLTDALIQRFQAGVPVRVIIEPTQYRNGSFPEYWLVGAMTDRLWAAGVPVRRRVHTGLTHMKVLVTSAVAMHGSANFTRNWQRDHVFFAAAGGRPALHRALADRFEIMWNDTVNFGPFQPQPPSTPVLGSPANTAGGVPTSVQLTWNRTPWAVAFDVYLGTDPASLAFAGRVNAVLTEDPPASYSFQPGALQPFTRYYWRVVARTFASDLNPSLVRASSIFAFDTGDGTPAPPPSSAPPPPAPPPSSPPPSTTSCTTIQPMANWICVNGGWVPPDSPLAASPTPVPAPTPPPSTVSCTTVKPMANWVCVNGGWVPPDSPLAAGASVPPTSTPSPPPAGATGCASPDPFVAMGGGVCIAGGWVPRNHPLATGGG